MSLPKSTTLDKADGIFGEILSIFFFAFTISSIVESIFSSLISSSIKLTSFFNEASICLEASSTDFLISSISSDLTCSSISCLISVIKRCAFPKKMPIVFANLGNRSGPTIINATMQTM